MSIATQITRLQNIKTLIREALVSKGIDGASSHDMEDFPDDIESIQTGGSGGMNFSLVEVFNDGGPLKTSFTSYSHTPSGGGVEVGKKYLLVCYTPSFSGSSTGSRSSTTEDGNGAAVRLNGATIKETILNAITSARKILTFIPTSKTASWSTYQKTSSNYGLVNSLLLGINVFEPATDVTFELIGGVDNYTALNKNTSSEVVVTLFNNIALEPGEKYLITCSLSMPRIKLSENNCTVKGFGLELEIEGDAKILAGHNGSTNNYTTGTTVNPTDQYTRNHWLLFEAVDDHLTFKINIGNNSSTSISYFATYGANILKVVES